MADRRLDHCLSTRGGRLFVEECDTLELLRQFGSPLFVLSEDQIRRNVRRFQAAFQAGWPDGPVKVLPAAKANWIPAVQCILASEGCGCDVYSPGELSVALGAGFPRELISVNGVPKDRDHILRSVAEGVRLTIDSVEELEVIRQAATDLGRTARVRLRLKPPISGFVQHSDFSAEGLVPTDVAALVYKGGLAFDDVVALGRRILGMDNVELVGIHEHHGRHQRHVQPADRQSKDEVGADHGHRAMREVDELQRPIDHAVPDRGQGIGAPRDQAVNQELGQNLHRSSWVEGRSCGETTVASQRSRCELHE